MMRYFAKFHDGSQTKNKAQVQAYAFMRKFASILLTSDAALEKMVADMKDGIKGINAAYPRCGDIDFRAYLDEDYRGKSIHIGEICSYSFYAVVSSFGVEDLTDKKDDSEQSTQVFEL
jgi:hypothetical protein